MWLDLWGRVPGVLSVQAQGLHSTFQATKNFVPKADVRNSMNVKGRFKGTWGKMAHPGTAEIMQMLSELVKTRARVGGEAL